MQSKNMMVFDFETLGTGTNSVVLGLAAVVFDISKKDNFSDLVRDLNRTFFSKFDVNSQVEKGRTISESTLSWWSLQDTDAQAILKPSVHDVTPDYGIQMFADFCDTHGIGKNSQVFVRGQSFDFPLLDSLMDDFSPDIKKINQGHFPCAFWNQNDIRTALRYMLLSPELHKVPVAKGTFDGFIKHNPIHDVCKDVILMQTAYQYSSGALDIPDDYVMI